MSLFGSSPVESPAVAAPSKSRLSLFDDEPTSAPGSKSSLFADDDNEAGASPWGMPTPKKAAKGELIKNLLPASDVPDSYIDTFDNVQRETGQSGGKISPAGVAKVLSAGKLDANAQSRIMSIITSGGELQDLGRNEFNVLLALIGLAQEHEDITLDGIDERRRSQCSIQIRLNLSDRAADLPEPNVPGLFVQSTTTAFASAAELASKPPQRPNTAPPPPASVSPSRLARTMQKDSLEFPEADPWGSPAMHRGHSHESPKINGTSRTIANGVHEPVRTTSNFTTASPEGSNGTSNQPTQDSSSTPAAGVWGSYDGNTTSTYNASTNPTIGGDGFGRDGNDGERPAPNPATRSFGGGRVTSGGVEESVVITLLPEKEGMFMFQHHNYQVTSPRRGSKVVRRYSDFVWLLDCLQKRYPFRQIPLLPPKRVGGM